MGFGGYYPLPLRLGGSSQEGWSPEQHARFASVLESVKRTVPLAIWTYDGSSPPAITYSAYSSLASNNIADAPVALRTGVGVVRFTLPASMKDPYGVERGFRISHGCGAADRGDIIVEVVGPNVVIARMRSSAWNLTDGIGTVAVW
jgi:hypothetical protein